MAPKNTATATVDTKATLDALISEATATVDTAKTDAAIAKSRAIRNGQKNAAPTAAERPREIVVQNGTVSSATITLTDGWTVDFQKGTFDASLVKPALLRESKNPWYTLVTQMAAGPEGFVVLTRPDGVKASEMKAPTARIKSAKNQARDRFVRNIDAVVVVALKEKGQWALVRAANVKEAQRISEGRTA